MRRVGGRAGDPVFPQPGRRRGERDAAPAGRGRAQAILKSFVAPPRAVRLAKRPPIPGGWGRFPVMGLNSTTQVDAVGYWRVRGASKALLTWEKAHISRRYSRQDVIIGPPSWSTLYTLPAIPGVLPDREMNVQVYDAGGGITVIKAAAMVSWQPPRPATEVIPASVRTVTIAASGPWRGNPGPVTITSAPAVRKLAALVNSLPVAVTGKTIPCPMGVGFTLTFRGAGGKPIAVATGRPSAGWFTSPSAARPSPSSSRRKLPRHGPEDRRPALAARLAIRLV